MANENKLKRPVGRPKGRDYTHIARIPLRPEQWDKLSKAAVKQGRSASHIVRELIDKHLKQYK